MKIPGHFSTKINNRGHYASESTAIKSIAPKIGCGWGTLRRWVQQEETETGHRDGMTSEERDKIEELEREVRKLLQANEILKKASAYFAPLSRSGTELDRPLKR